MVEKTEYFKTSLDCVKNGSNISDGLGPISNIIGNNDGTIEQGTSAGSPSNYNDLLSITRDCDEPTNNEAPLDPCCKHPFCLGNKLEKPRRSYVRGGNESQYDIDFLKDTTFIITFISRDDLVDNRIIISKYDEGTQKGWYIVTITDGFNIGFRFVFRDGNKKIQYQTEKIESWNISNSYVNLIFTYQGSLYTVADILPSTSRAKIIVENGIKFKLNISGSNTQNLDEDVITYDDDFSGVTNTSKFVIGNFDSVNGNNNFMGVIYAVAGWNRILPDSDIGGYTYNVLYNNSYRVVDTDKLFEYRMCRNSVVDNGDYLITDFIESSLTYRTAGLDFSGITEQNFGDCFYGFDNLGTDFDDEECGGDCTPECGSNGVAPCINNNLFIDKILGRNWPTEYTEYARDITHGLISWYDNEIYYTPYIPTDDTAHNKLEYKGNLLLPTTIMELGSSTYCDIDDIPFIMDKLKPTTFQISTEDATAFVEKVNPSTKTETDSNGIERIINIDNREIIKFTPRDGGLNLRAYVELSCFSVVCMNTLASINGSQIGVNIIDKNDIGLEIGNCFVRVSHDDEIRSYFCRRFNGYKSDLTFKHNIPGSISSDNKYDTYPEIKLRDKTNGDIIVYSGTNPPINAISTYNDDDFFIPGDLCGYIESNKTDYFYGVAPGQTSKFIDYPNTQPIGFGNFPNLPDIDFIDDDLNGFTNIKGIKSNRSQTPYYMYFGLVPGKTALHKTVSKFFADKINAVTLQGIGGTDGQVDQNINNTPNINNEEGNTFSVFKTCLGETLINTVTVGGNNNGN